MLSRNLQMGTCIIDKIGSLKRNKGEVSVFSTKFFGGRHMHVWSRMSHKAIFLFFFLFKSGYIQFYQPYPLFCASPISCFVYLKKWKVPKMLKQSALDIIERFDKALNSRDHRFCFVCLSERVIPRLKDLDAYGTVLVSRTNVTNHRTAYIRKFVIWQYIHAQWKNVVFHAYAVSLSTLVGQSNTYVRNMLRRNPPEVRVTSGQQLCTEIIYIVFQTSVQLF